MITHEIIREYFPGATDEQCRDATWICTGFPSFWNMPGDGNTPEECFRKQIADAREKTADIEEAMAMSDAAVARQMEEFHRKESEVQGWNTNQ